MDLKRFTTWRGGYAFAACLVALASLALLPFRPYLTPTTVMLLYVPVIIVAGRAAGARASAVSAVLGFLALDLLFVPPYYHLVVASVAEWSALLVFLVVALVSGQQTGVLRERERAALDRQRELEFLNRLSFRVASEKSLQPTAEFIASQITEVLGATRVALYLGTPGAPSAECLAQAGDPMPSSGEAAVVAWVVRTGAAVGMPDVPGLGVEEGVVTVGVTEAVPGVSADGLYLPLHGARGLQGALYIRFAEPNRPSSDDARLLVAVANLAAASLERQRLEEEAAHADVLREADRLKATFVSSISHELKTPLAAATARVTGLVDEREHFEPERVWEELAEVSDDLQRLNCSIGDLLDLSRLESDAWRPHLEHYELDEVLGTVLARVPAESAAESGSNCPQTHRWSTSTSRRSRARSDSSWRTRWRTRHPTRRSSWAPRSEETFACGSRITALGSMIPRSPGSSRSSTEVPPPRTCRPARAWAWRSPGRSSVVTTVRSWLKTSSPMAHDS